MLRWMDVRDLGLILVLLGLIGWALSGCSAPREGGAYQDCLSCGVKMP